MARYAIHIRELDLTIWRRSRNSIHFCSGFFPNESWENLDTAIEVATVYHVLPRIRITGEDRGQRGTRVIDTITGKVVWQQVGDNKEEHRMDGTPDITEPIKLDRTKLIDRLNEIHAEEEKKRLDAKKKEDDARKEVEDFVKANVDRVAEFFKNRCGVSWGSTLEDLADREFRGDNYKPKDAEPTRRESDSEKFVRVLEMSADETVSLTPDQPLYELL